MYSDSQASLYIFFNYFNSTICALVFLKLLQRIPFRLWSYFVLYILTFLSIIGIVQVLLSGPRPPIIFYETSYTSYWLPFLFSLFLCPVLQSPERFFFRSRSGTLVFVSPLLPAYCLY
ncbi:putative membrane protein [Synechococcus sp. TAK9802]|nr:putative membrane protein [Synechococcus sp. TAK9802]